LKDFLFHFSSLFLRHCRQLIASLLHWPW
jgi:hypothetical protein